MNRKINLKTYTQRKVSGVRKRRLRKKILKHIEHHFMVYCVQRWGMSGAFHALYSDADIKDLVYTSNPFLTLIPKLETFYGQYE